MAGVMTLVAMQGGGAAAGPSFNDLTLDNYDVDEDAGPDALVGNIVGTYHHVGHPVYGTSGYYIVSQEEPFWFYVDDEQIYTTGDQDYETNASPSNTVREFFDNDPGGGAAPTLPYHDTVIEITVNNVSEGPVLGSELNTDPSFDDGPGWTGNGGAFIVDGDAEGQDDAGSIARSCTTQTGTKTFRTVLVITSISFGGVKVRLSGSATVAGTNRSAAGTYEQDLIVTDLGTLGIQSGTGGSGDSMVASLSVKELVSA